MRTLRFPQLSPAARKLTITIVAVLVITVGSSGSLSAADPYAADPLGLFADYDETSHYATRPERIEVFICRPHYPDHTLDQLVDYLNNDSGLLEFWSSLSNGEYDLRFVKGSTLTSGSGSCWMRAETEGSRRHTAAYVAAEVAGTAKPGRSGPLFSRTWGGTFGNGRFFTHYFETRPDFTYGWVSSISGGIGTILNWPRSFTGVSGTEGYAQVDNPMDLRSGANWVRDTSLDDDRFTSIKNEHYTSHNIGTVTANRYAAGWIDPSDVHIYRGGTDLVTLHPGWETGTQMLVIPSGEQGRFLTMGVRVAKRHDAGIVKEGVEAYIIDQTPGASQFGGACDDRPCAALHRRTIPYPHDTERKIHWGLSMPADPTRHVSQPGDYFAVFDHVAINVIERVGDAYLVAVTGRPTPDGPPPSTPDPVTDSGTFADDDGSAHEPDIEHIVSLGITRGCATGPARYCPDRSVTRAEMAAFLIRALGEPHPRPTIPNTYGDVPAGEWYTPFVVRVAELGIDTGSGTTWEPDRALTRLEMARWLTEAFPHIHPAVSPIGLFGDVPQSQWSLAEGLYRAGITRGCTTRPLRYCPDRSVTRAEMASFLVRSLP